MRPAAVHAIFYGVVLAPCFSDQIEINSDFLVNRIYPERTPVNVLLANKLQLSDIPEKIRSVLMEQLQFLNPKWIENNRMGRWNKGTPKILKFYRKLPGGGLSIPRGYMRQIYLLCRRYKEPIEIDDRRRKLDDIEFTFQGRLKPFQQDAADIMLSKDFGTLSAPTGSGKTVMALNMIARRRQPALVIVHTRDLAVQWTERISTFLNIAADEIGFIGGGRKRMAGTITVAMVQSLYKCAKQVAPKIGHLVVDECHRAPSRTFTEAVTAFDAQYMLGLSATPWRRDKLSKLIFWHLGDVHHEVSKSHLLEKGHLLDIEVLIRNTDFKPYYDPVNEYSKMLSELTSNDDRNRLIAADIASEIEQGPQGGVCLVLSDRKRHCESLRGILKHKHHLATGLITGDVGIAQRQHVLQQLNSGELRVLIATGQLIGEGFDHPGLTTLFLTTPIKFSGRVIQYLGRVLRPVEGIQKARIFDYVDVHVQPLASAAKARQKVYDSQGKSMGTRQGIQQSG
jgi:superfamily II DNA or RNA helicase